MRGWRRSGLKRRRTFSPSYLMRWGGALLILACMHLPLIPLLSPLCCSLGCNSSNFWQFSSQIKNRRKNKQNQEEVFQTNCQASAGGAETKAAAQSFCSRRVQICRDLDSVLAELCFWVLSACWGSSALHPIVIADTAHVHYSSLNMKSFSKNWREVTFMMHLGGGGGSCFLITDVPTVFFCH